MAPFANPRFPGRAALLSLSTLLLGLVILLQSCAIPPPLLDRIRETGELVVVTRYGPTTYYESRGEMTGIEYDLVTAFAEELGVRVRWELVDRSAQALKMVISGNAHIGAAGLANTEHRREQVRFARSYHESTPQLVYHQGTAKPRSLADLGDGLLEVVQGSSQEHLLESMREQYPGLQWHPQSGVDEEELLSLLSEGLIDYVVADSDQVVLSRRFYPELRVAFDLAKPRPLAWAFPHSQDSSLFDAAEDFLDRFEQAGRLEDLVEKYYGHTSQLNFVDRQVFLRRIQTTLPTYREMFERAAKETGLDWKLLAAVGYQESHWNPKAVSPTGVRGIMMLTSATTRLLGLKDRTDPWQSIIGGARYLVMQEQRIPERIARPDRLWLALAGYNIGFGHLEDARILTSRRGGNPDSWRDLKENLPLLSRPKYYRDLEHGRARGREPVIYVDNVRAYYDLLTWYLEQQEGPPQPSPGDYPMSVLPVTL